MLYEDLKPFMQIAVRGQVTAKVLEAETLIDGTGRILLAAPVEPKGLAVVEARLQPSERAKIAWKFFYRSVGLEPGEDISHCIGKCLLITCDASKDGWGVVHTNRISRYNECRPDQKEACEAAIARILPQIDALEKSSETTTDQSDIEERQTGIDAVWLQESTFPEMTLDTPDDELPF